MKLFHPKNIFIYLITFYRCLISPFFPSTCRFYPTCSSYAIQAIQKNGVFWGGRLMIMRLLRCHPFCQSVGHDPLL